jgi:hypothetical protein
VNMSMATGRDATVAPQALSCLRAGRHASTVHRRTHEYSAVTQSAYTANSTSVDQVHSYVDVLYVRRAVRARYGSMRRRQAVARGAVPREH